jgi:hypothetical protein
MKSRRLYAADQLASNQIPASLLSRFVRHLDFDLVSPSFDTSSTVHSRSPLHAAPGPVTPSLPCAFTTTALNGSSPRRFAASV